ncbi:anaerobic ribonucleoside triphosphate reductase [Paenibacillus sp. HN-1]|uniref:anaerobic ribonucleoside triphosphate reductase n=1 Tax=Paenibacillus TaxID=44249 RepID=UPI001CA9D5D0|nr:MULTISPECIES: anaerobic ribonucleoside triphosphate reductase [Paenibacillus]MBY9080000.1 anaerobic ribonucleoside triphosphate reductase [Paenibacillus sp. CGMCC 1.18879]MBY9086698.1 anaerobic ribonucleoside triphosphate reductase [Paenibacillus sinensis]
MTLLEKWQTNGHSMNEELLEEVIGLGRDIIDSRDMDLLRENANLNGESFSGKMSKFGSEYSKWYARSFTMPPHLVKAIKENVVYVHDLDQYVIGTTNCIFIPFDKLLREGFNTGNGSVRPPNSIMTAMALTAIIFQSQQNAQYGGVSGSKLDHDLAPYVAKSFAKLFRKGLNYFEEAADIAELGEITMSRTDLQERYPKVFRFAMKETQAETLQAAESLIHNLNTMSSRAGGQIPFTSINYGTCTTPEGQMVIDSLLTATMNGLGSGETPVFPIQIFKCKKGVNQQLGDPNYELFLKAAECSARRLYPNFANLDAPLNLMYYDPADPDTEFATMGCRTRVLGDRFGRNRCSGKGNLSFNTLNLVRLGIRHGIVTGRRLAADEQGFYTDLDHYMEIALEGLLHRFRIQIKQKAKASDFMMREGVWEGGEHLAPDDAVGDLLKHGSLSIGFIGLAECMKAMYGKHHAEDDDVYAKGFEIIRHMREFCDRKSEELDLNITLFATPAEGLSGKFTKIDRREYGAIAGVTDREYYTNSFHVPVYYQTGAANKIQLEARFHDLCNAGAISYVELDGNARSNPAAFVKIIRYALDQDISYFSINHPVDRCSGCGYEGVIGTNCPSCGTHEEEVHIRRLRRVTGYLTGDYQTRFNAAKQAEVRDRVKHL